MFLFPGYGSIYPSTDAGKGFFIPYALFGIPLMLLLIGSISEIILKPVKKFTRKCSNGSRCTGLLDITVLGIPGLIIFIVLYPIVISHKVR